MFPRIRVSLRYGGAGQFLIIKSPRGHPLGCLPLWERGVITLQIADKRKRITGKQDFNRAEKFSIVQEP